MEDILLSAHVSDWYNFFLERRDVVEVYESCGHPVIMKTDENVKK
jgi:hypothetical protein